MIDAASGGSINKKSVDEAYEIIDEMASNNPFERSQPKKAGMYQVEENTALAVQLATLQKQMSQVLNAVNVPQKICELCEGPHLTKDCQVGNPFAQPEQVNYTNNYQRGQGNSYGNNNQYNPNWRNHPNLSWGNNNNVLQPQQNFNAPEKNDMLAKYIEMNEKRLESNELLLKNQSATIMNLELQLGQIHNLLSSRTQAAFPSDTEKNPREQANAVTLRSGTKYECPTQKEPEVEADEVVRKDKNIVEGIDHEEEVEYERKKKEDEALKRRMDEHARNETIPF